MTPTQLGDVRLPPRFWKKVRPQANGCWDWTSNIMQNRGYGSWGYGRLKVNGRSFLAHRLAYEHLVGPIPTDLEIDHLCRNRACVNPSHMEPVTHQENGRRGLATIVNVERAQARTSCINGHTYTEKSTRPYQGKRVCRPCAILRQRRYSQRRREGVQWSPKSASSPLRALS